MRTPGTPGSLSRSPTSSSGSFRRWARQSFAPAEGQAGLAQAAVYSIHGYEAAAIGARVFDGSRLWTCAKIRKINYTNVNPRMRKSLQPTTWR